MTSPIGFCGNYEDHDEHLWDGARRYLCAGVPPEKKESGYGK